MGYGVERFKCAASTAHGDYSVAKHPADKTLIYTDTFNFVKKHLSRPAFKYPSFQDDALVSDSEFGRGSKKPPESTQTRTYEGDRQARHNKLAAVFCKQATTEQPQTHEPDERTEAAWPQQNYPVKPSAIPNGFSGYQVLFNVIQDNLRISECS